MSRLYTKTLSMYVHIISLLVVDLRSLNYSREIDINRFPFGEDTQGLRAGFAVTVTGMLGAAEWQMCLSPDSWSVDVKNTGENVAHG